MRRHYPLDPATGLESSALLPWTDGVPATGAEGSYPGHALVTDIEAELLNLQHVAGLADVVDGSDLTQVVEAVARGGIFIAAMAGTANALLALIPNGVAIQLQPWMRIRQIATQTNTQAAVTYTLTGVGSPTGTVQGPLLRRDGSPLQRGDIPVGFPFDVQPDGAGNFRMSGAVASDVVGTITTAVSYTVHGAGADFADFNAAFAFASLYRIARSGSLTFVSNAGKWTYTTSVIFSHPNGDRVFVQGPALKGALPGTNLQITGSDGSGSSATASNAGGSRWADTTANLVTLRAAYAAELTFTGGSGFSGMGQIGGVQDLLLTSDGSGYADLFNWQTGLAPLTRMAAVGASFRGICAFGARIPIYGFCYALGSGLHGATAEVGGQISLQTGATLVGCSNGSNGVFANSGGVQAPSIGTSPGTGTTYTRGNGLNGAAAGNVGTLILPTTALSNNNAGSGFRIDGGGSASVPGTIAANNGLAGYFANNARMDASNTTGSGSPYGFYAANFGFILRTGSSVSGTSATAAPAVGQTGNNGALIA